ncbi:16S rRNA (guanine(527)-N(7))-methyltransferase RsmG [Denitromonas iodatirespirans]|uniref:Ribosomal RNA small subunit methyltransferase G n=1 Tax=Denitromonas iodatirespirans TaxID=2795389 RepID=A0A944HBX5_DENI1|nr:16S rRNA (guanine(527)-N(7))-methyltransferase RsmG [Denitromonas iodatirespirans]MBT0962122.1 16S rRNA (guanine(527)-N(7))-methyltransferase RsmG [Denitromonas iodatirespirans]
MSDRASLERGLAAMGIDLPESAHDKLVAYAALLAKWNKVYNLTAIRDPGQMMSHHLFDALSVLPHLAGVTQLADVGSGGGLPGIPLAIARPDMSVTSIETVNKKATFQQQAKIELKLANFEPVCARVEEVRCESGFDGIISRAFSELADFIRLTAHLLAPGGRFYAMKGVYPHEEIERLPDGFVVVEAIELVVPALDAHRHLIIIERSADA